MVNPEHLGPTARQQGANPMRRVFVRRHPGVAAGDHPPAGVGPGTMHGTCTSKKPAVSAPAVLAATWWRRRVITVRPVADTVSRRLPAGRDSRRDDARGTRGDRRTKIRSTHPSEGAGRVRRSRWVRGGESERRPDRASYRYPVCGLRRRIGGCATSGCRVPIGRRALPGCRVPATGRVASGRRVSRADPGSVRRS